MNTEEILAMFSHSNLKKRHITITLFFALTILQLWNSSLCAQMITPIVTVVPPYGNKLSDYTSQPNKIAVILSPGSQDANKLSLYIEGSITSLNGDIQIYTRPGHKPAHPITVSRTGDLFLPYQLTYPEIRDIFDENWLMYKGITRQQVATDGLPEGTYRICIKVFNYNDNRLMSNEACSNTFNAASVDAPQIIQPMHQSQIQFMPVQSLVFSWTPPPGAPANTQYKLRIVEVDKNNSVNPMDALRSIGYPKFFETTVTGTTYLYSAANPVLTPGKQYAFIVVADDPSKRTRFRNMGASQMHVFTYQPQQPKPLLPAIKPATPPPTITAPAPIMPPAKTKTIVKGTLKYKYPNQSKTYPIQNGNIRLVAKYYVEKSDGSLTLISHFGSFGYYQSSNSYFDNGPQTNEEIAAPVKTDENGNFEFDFFTSYKMGLIDDHYQCDVKPPAMNNDYQKYKNYANNTKHFGAMDFHVSTDHAGSLCSANSLNFNNKLENIINTAENSDQISTMVKNAHMSSYAFSSGDCKLYRYYVIEFLEPQNNYYLDPDKDKANLILAQPGDNVSANVIAPVRTANLEVSVNSTAKGSLTYVNNQPEMMGVDVYLLRKKLLPVGTSAFPKDDVTPDKTDDYPIDKSITNNYDIVGKQESDQSGKAVFNNLVYSDITSYQYYIYATTPIRDGQFNYNDVGALSIAYNSISAGSHFNNHSASDWTIYNISYKVNMKPKFPSVYVELMDGPRRIREEAKVLLLEKWDYYNGDMFWYHFMSAPTLNLTVSHPPSYTMVKSDTSLYGYSDLDLLIDADGKTVRGPERKISIQCPGYRDTTITVTEPLKLGQKKYYMAFLKLGATINGKVIDAETQQPLEGVAVKMSYSPSCVFTDNNGMFRNLLAKRLPGTTQYIIYQKDGYVNDSTAIFINGSISNTPPKGLYKNYRRLMVHVRDSKTGGVLKDMRVTLPGVMVKKLSIESVSKPDFDPNVTPSQTTKGSKSMETLSKHPSDKSSQMSANTTDPLKIYNTSGTGLQLNESLDDNSTEEPLSGITDYNGTVSFTFRAQEDNDMMFEIAAENPETNPGNYFAPSLKAKIPNGKETTEVVLQMKKAACIEGHIYAGESNASPVGAATVNIDLPFFGDRSVITDASGYYKLRNIPVSYGAKIQILKSGIAGDEAEIDILQASDVCMVKDFHMKTFEGIDLTKLLGFNIQPIITEDKGSGTVTMSGSITGLALGNIKATEEIPFYGVKFTKDNQTNKWVFTGNEINTTKNYIDLSLYDSYKGRAYGSNGIKVERISGTETGNIVGKVRVDSTNFGGMGFVLPSVYLTSAKSTPPSFTVFSSGQTSPNSSYYVCNPSGGDIRYTIKGFQDGALAKAQNSRFNQEGLFLNTVLEANISSVKPSNMKIEVGDVHFKKSGMAFSTTNPLNIGIGNWSLKCNNWTIGSEGLVVNSGILATGVDIPFENIKITSSALKTDQAILHFNKLKLLGIHDLVVTSNNVVLDYTSTWGGVYAWQIYAGPQNGQPTVGYIQGLPSMAPGEKIEFSNILLSNQGDNVLQMVGKTFKLHNFINFTPNPGESMQLTKDFFSIRGAYQLNIPYAEMKYGDAVFYKNNNTIAYMPKYVEALDFTHQGVVYKVSVTALTDRLLTAKGTVEEPGNLPALNITLTSTPSYTKIDVDPGQKIKLGSTNYLDQVTGGINVANHQWQSFKFDGYPKGMGGISEGNQKLSFEVTGAVKATGQSINVSEIPSFPGLTLTYDMQNARLIGYCDLNMNLGGIKLAGGVNTIMDGKGWIFQVDGSMEVPGLGGMNMFGLFGNYNGIPAEFASKFGSAVCLPAGFTQHIKGFFLSAGITKQILPKIDKDFGIVSVKAGLDLSLDARVFMQFGGGGSVYGLGVLARGNAYVSGACKATCTTLSAGASLQAGISGTYSAGVFNIDGCTSLSLGLKAEQCFPLVPFTGLCGSCFSVSLPSLTLGANMHMDSNGGFNMGITTSSCDQQCH